jgi:hypothetical protein
MSINFLSVLAVILSTVSSYAVASEADYLVCKNQSNREWNDCIERAAQCCPSGTPSEKFELKNCQLIKRGYDKACFDHYGPKTGSPVPDQGTRPPPN